jgi:hypothetical protein
MIGQVKMFTSQVDDAGDHGQVSFGDNLKEGSPDWVKSL